MLSPYSISNDPRTALIMNRYDPNRIVIRSE